MPTNVLVLNKSWVVTGAGNPEGQHAAPVGSIYMREEGGVGTCLYIKESGSGSTGWVSCNVGDVKGPASSATTSIPVFNGTSGKLLIDGGVLLNEVARINGSNTFTGVQTMSSGIVSSSVKFPSVQVPSVDSNTLDDYEEGVWTPAVSFSTNTTGVTYQYQAAVYIKIGLHVQVHGRVTLTSKGTSTGTISVVGLPFAVSSATFFANGSVGWYLGFAGLTSIPTILGFQGTTRIDLFHGTASGSVALTDANVTNGMDLLFSMAYITGA